jgi:hypothetical protein
MHQSINTKAAPVVQQQWLKQQQHNVCGGFGGRQVAAVALVAALAMALAEQW